MNTFESLNAFWLENSTATGRMYNFGKTGEFEERSWNDASFEKSFRDGLNELLSNLVASEKSSIEKFGFLVENCKKYHFTRITSVHTLPIWPELTKKVYPSQKEWQKSVNYSF
jgi:hypothetical protein